MSIYSSNCNFIIVHRVKKSQTFYLDAFNIDKIKLSKKNDSFLNVTE